MLSEKMANEVERAVYDDFSGPNLNPEKWIKAFYHLPDGTAWLYYDPNTKLKVAQGKCIIEVNPFSRKNDKMQICDNPKTLLASVQRIGASQGVKLSVESNVGCRTFNNNPEDIWDAFITLNLFDFQSGLVLDFVLNDHKLVALYERLYMPGITDERTAFSKYYTVPVETEPEKLHHFKISYSQSDDKAEWFVDGEKAWEVIDIPVKASGFYLGMGLMTLKPIRPLEFPYYFPKSTSLHGQGAKGIWFAFTISKERAVKNKY